MSKQQKPLKRIAVIHPDLGIGGAERLIVDACKALQESKYDVQIYTSFHDKERCFEETRDGTLKVKVVGNWIPRSIFGRFHALLAYFKMIYIALHLLLYSKHDLVICDQVPACIPILKLDFKNKFRIIFYCHFPDQLLARHDNLLKLIYRYPIDKYEEFSTRMADIILVNSCFTKSVVKRTFKSIREDRLEVLYPCVDSKQYVYDKSYEINCSNLVTRCREISKKNWTFISLNRFERKKNLALAIEALSECIMARELVDKTGVEWTFNKGIHLIVAGGYDERLQDCVTYYNELESLVRDLNLSEHVTFVKSPNDNEKLVLMHYSDAVVYTPENEHFGIVPLEAMAMEKPVIAAASGGPLETISDEVGSLCQTDKYSFADAMLRICTGNIRRLPNAGHDRISRLYSYDRFREKLSKICDSALL